MCSLWCSIAACWQPAIRYRMSPVSSIGHVYMYVCVCCSLGFTVLVQHRMPAFLPHLLLLDVQRHQRDKRRHTETDKRHEKIRKRRREKSLFSGFVANSRSGWLFGDGCLFSSIGTKIGRTPQPWLNHNKGRGVKGVSSLLGQVQTHTGSVLFLRYSCLLLTLI